MCQNKEYFKYLLYHINLNILSFLFHSKHKKTLRRPLVVTSLENYKQKKKKMNEEGVMQLARDYLTKPDEDESEEFAVGKVWGKALKKSKDFS